MELKLIGKVKSDKGFAIVIEDDYKEALTAMDGFSHLLVTWWANQVDQPGLRETKVLEKPYLPGPEHMGVFATRSPIRPNPICISVIDVKHIDYEHGIIETWYIDAEEETPVLDIKPYYPCSDVAREATLPEWCAGLPVCIEDSADFDWSVFFNF
ncbi:TrmO family methyltransferase domain-containing protein [Anoxynatronum sibiricum]|uniref:TrmO family methyltransferase n=1 Tax=Anoxynatronum sibiricum TaxID=210623 RepID=A0ABU9VT45_9CLOT